MIKQLIRDGMASFRNEVSGLGALRDKARQGYWQVQPMSVGVADAIYRGSWMGRQGVDVPIDDIVRAGLKFDGLEDAAMITDLEQGLEEMEFMEKLRELMVASEVASGAVLVWGDGTDEREPIIPENVGQGGLDYLHVMPSTKIGWQRIENDIRSPDYNNPAMWRVTSVRGSADVDPSRVAKLVTRPRPRNGLHEATVWGDTIYQSLREPIENALSGDAAIVALLQEAKIDILSIENLTANMGSPEYREAMQARAQVTSDLKSIMNTMMIDKNDEFNQKVLTFGGLDAVHDRLYGIVCAAFDIPAVRFFGKSAPGLNSTGESDLANYHESLDGKRRRWLSPILRKAMPFVVRHILGTYPEELTWGYGPLRQMTEAEIADLEKKRAEADQIYLNGLSSSSNAIVEAIADRLAAEKTYPTLAEKLESERIAPVPDTEDPNPVEPAIEGEEGRNGAQPSQDAQRLQDLAMRSLYVRRDVVNAAEILQWARRQGFTVLEPEEDLHVTLAYSELPVDWRQAGRDWSEDERTGELVIAAGGLRVIEPLGDKGAVVLHFSSDALEWRHRSIHSRTGALWRWDEYQPHLTLTYNAEGVDLAEVEPYSGPIVLGPEVFEEIRQFNPASAEEADDE